MPLSPVSPTVAERILAIVTERGPGKTVCPSEIARSLAGAGGDWRSRMGEVHRAVDDLLDAGKVGLSWKGEAITRRQGPYRIGGA